MTSEVIPKVLIFVIKKMPKNISGVNNGAITNVIKINYQIDLYREHVRHVCLRKKEERFKQRISENEE